MTSRLDRLFILLESGSSAVTRRAAAKQIGEVQKLHPHELHNLLNRLIGYLHHSSWDTRIAAAQAVEAILSNVPKWDPSPLDSMKQSDDVKNTTIIDKNEFLTFEKFDLAQVLQKGARLMGSEGTEFDFQEDNESGNSDRLVRQRALLNEKLGIAQAGKLGINLNDLVTLDDMKNEGSTSDVNQKMVPVQDILQIKQPKVSKLVDCNGQNLSCREINRAKRKARQNVSGNTGGSSGNFNRSNSSSNNGSFDEPEKKKSKLDDGPKFEIYYSLNEPVPDATGSWPDATKWPFEQFCSKLYVDLFNPRWETRHGSATALRELMNGHSSGGGKCAGMSKEEMHYYHGIWLEDAALRLLCVLSLDRFGDFVSDQVVAPVRETCSQVLGTILKEMSPDKVHETVIILLKLIKQNEWEVRHGGLLGLKYMLVVREDLVQKFLSLTINDILLGLFDCVDDVGAVAASTLIPVANWLPKLLNSNQVSSIVKMLWDLLLDQDELASACNSFMGLLAAILCLPDASQWIQMEPMTVLIPRLWPFLSHSTSSVRKSTLRTLKTLTENNGIIKLENENDNETSSSSTPIESDATHSNGTNVRKMNFDSKSLLLNFGVKDWEAPLLQEALRHIYQRLLVEPNEDIQDLCKEVWINLVKNAELSALLHAACPFVSSWICMAMQPSRLAFDPSVLVFSKPLQGSKEKRSRGDDLGGCSGVQQKLFLGGNEATPIEIREKNYMKARINASRILGFLSQYLVKPAPGVIYTPDVESPIDCYTKVLMGYLQSRSALQRLICGMIISFWALTDPSIRPGPPQLQEKLKHCVTEYIYYDEVALSFTRLLQEARDFIATLKQYKVSITEFDNCNVLTLNQIQALCTKMTENLKEKHNLKTVISDLLEERRRGLQNSFQQTSTEQNEYNVSTQASLAGAIVCLQCLPDKLNPIIKPLMESIKREECELLQQLSAVYLVQLLDQISNRNPNPNNKIVTNLCTLLKSDTDFTPQINYTDKPIFEYDPDKKIDNPYYGILTLMNQQKLNTENNGTNLPRGPGRPALLELSLQDVLNSEDTTKKLNRVQRIGATYAIKEICNYFGSNLKEKIPILWTIMFNNIEKIINDCEGSSEKLLAQTQINKDEINDLLTSLQLIEIALPNIHSSLHDELFELLHKFGILLTHPLKAIRNMVSRCLATMASVDNCRVMNFVVEHIVPLLQKIEYVIYRQGAAEAIDQIVEKLQFKMVPYVVLLVVPLLGRMSDPNESVRLMSTHCFATLIQLMPLDGSSNNALIASKELQARKSRDKEFLEYLFRPKTIPDFKVPIPINAELRSYQQAGINWLWFLNRYNLHGILCDDMGLGKTLQTICILAGDHHKRIEENQSPLPSIVICPPTLTGHWVYEVAKFLPSGFLRPLHYVGLPIGREKLRSKVGSCNLIVASYDTVRKDIDFFSSVHWNYCVLDEGHIIKNGKTKSSKAIKMLKANHRLILSGTPIQNNVLELWSLFDFLMPGFLGTERQFMIKYSRPILASRDPKSSSKEQEAGVLAMEALHRQVLPFLLRRIKEDVLTDLPPKITQDLLCELSPLQERLYEDFSKTHLNSEIRDCIESLGGENLNKKTHIFQALRYLQNVCNHPKLVLSANHPEWEKIQQEISQNKGSLDDIEHSAKLPALKQLLLDCGIGVENIWENVSVNQHRALIFCQLKAMLDIVENDLLKKHLPAVSYLRLDGSVPASIRHEIVTKFNDDPSIDVLLLTTQVGGLGLNLTGADTVIFVEHDWNPMKDLQAMDRAHRIGQKKVVNVYRLITRKSLEEKIMGLQKFKILTANTVVSAENASMETMGTDQLLDLFNLTDDTAKSNKNKDGSSSSSSSSSGSISISSLTSGLSNNHIGNMNSSNNNSNSSGGNISMKQVIESLPELWEDKQYEEEYDLTQFVQSLKK